MKGGPSSVQPTPPPQSQSSSQQDPAVISFIPTTVDRSPVLERTSKDMDESSPLKNRPQTSNSDEISVDGERKRGPNDCWLVDDFAHQQPDEHVLLDFPASMSVHERFLVQLPIEQIEENRDACNQRATVLYGVLEERENAKKELLRVAHEITKTWTKRIHVQFFPNSKEVLFKRRNLAPVPDIMASYRQQTYYDQKVIVGWCIDNFMEMIYDFLDEKSFTLPTMEALDILCGMMENCRDIHGIVTLAVELIPQIVKLEERFRSFHSDCMPGIIGSQLAYVLCCYFSEHIDYFLLCKEAPRIINS
ncbi:Med12 domain-containing protein [Aphelenchoides bicaudatus]|nr:Med12 domain-containing protein [Aphelenchoides bicaudatus]